MKSSASANVPSQMKKQNRFKSPIVWASGVAAAILVAQAMGFINVDNADLLTKAGQAILAALIGVGVLNSPTDSKNF